MNKLVPLEFKNQRIMTTKTLAEQYGTEENNIKNNFNNNKNRFVEGKHYYKLQGEELREFKRLVNNIDEAIKFAPILYLWTEKGAARHAKILDTDEAWEVYEALEETYFRVKENPYMGLSKEIQAIFELDKKQQLFEKEVKEIKDTIQDMRNNSTLTPAHCDIINKRYKAKIIRLLGGKDSLSYKDNSLRSKVYADFQKELRKEFGVSTYKEILVRELDKLFAFIDGYKPKEYLLMSIVGYNNQLKISI